VGRTRAELAGLLEDLAAQHRGPAFVREISRLAEDLDDEERNLLQDLLLARAAEEETRRAARSRANARGWVRRMLERADERAAELSRRRGG
jgi:hypothetical protein